MKSLSEALIDTITLTSLDLTSKQRRQNNVIQAGKYLSWNGNKIENKLGIKELEMISEALKNNTALKSLLLSSDEKQKKD